MKKLFATTLLLALATLSFAYDFTVDGIYYNILSADDKTVEVTNDGWNSYSANDITVPASVTNGEITYSVVQIGEAAFQGCSKITSVTLPSTITAIGKSAFNYCNSLVSINIPNSVTSIGSYAFSCCTSLQSVELPNTITTINSEVFGSCTSLTSITIPESVTSIEPRAFANCTGLTTIQIPKGVTSISGTAIAGCTNLASLTVDSENTTYDSRDNCNAIIETSSNTLVVGCKNTTFPDDVTAIGDYAFSRCTGLTSITIGKGITTIGDYAFSGSSNLVSVEISESVTNIGNGTFSSCSALKTIDIPISVTSIGYSCFSECRSLESFVWPFSVTDIAYSMFENCEALKSVEIAEGVTSIGNTAFRQTALTEVTFPSTLTSVGDRAFEECSSMKTITFSRNDNATVTLNSGAFRYCPITTIYAGSTTPPTVAYSGYYHGISDCSKVTLYVPYGSKSNYEDYVEKPDLQNGWYGITNIVEANYERLVINDEYAYTYPGAETYPDGEVFTKIAYYRVYKNTNFQALFLPYSLAYDDYSENFDLYAIDNFTQYDTDGDGTLDATYLYVVKAKSGDVTHPNYPYLIKAKKASESQQPIVAKDKTLYPGATTGENNILTTQTATRTYTFTGNYANDFDMYSNGYWGLAGGVLHQAANADVKLSSFRWYLDIKDRSYTPFGSNASDSSAKVINILELGEDGEASFIGTLSTGDATPVSYISVDGKVSNQPFHGLNIIRMSDGTTRKQIMK